LTDNEVKYQRCTYLTNTSQIPALIDNKVTY